MTTIRQIFLLLSATLFLLPSFAQDAPPNPAPPTSWLTDEQARDVAAAAIHSVYPQPCYSTYRNENLESFVFSIRKKQIVSSHLNNSVYFYRVASDSCEYVVTKDGKDVLMMQASSDCCEYGIVAVDRSTAKTYWFAEKEKSINIFKGFARDEQLQSASSNAKLFVGLYLDLVWGHREDQEITDRQQLRNLVQSNFQSAYSPYRQDHRWQQKFDSWWQRFQSQTSRLQLETTYEQSGAETLVRGYNFSGFSLTIPRSDPPPKGKPALLQWSLLVKADGTIEERPSKIIYSSP